MHKLKVLFYEPASGYGGSTSALAQLINHLDTNKFDPIVIIKNRGPQVDKIRNAKILKLMHYAEPEKNSSLLYLYCFFTKILPEAFKIYFILKKEKINLVHNNISIMSGIPVIIAAKLAGIPCISHFRLTRRLLKREKLFSRWIDKLIVLNAKTSYLAKEAIANEKIRLIYDGIEIDSTDTIGPTLFRKELSINNEPVIGVIGRIVKGKGQKEFILSAKKVLKSIPEAIFLIVGDVKGGNESYYQEILTLVKNEQLANKIIFTGWRNDVKNVLSNLDVLVFPTTTFPEGLPNIIIEAMELNKPIVATNIPGVSDIVINNETGFLIQPGDINAMAEKISHLIINQEEAEIMGKRGRRRVEKYFNIKNTADQIKDVYIESLKSKKAEIRYLMSHIISSSLYCTGISKCILRILLIIKPTNFIFMYHRVNENKNGLFPGLPVEVFESQIRCLNKYFDFVTLSQFIEQIGESKKPIATITFDDGYKNTFNTAWRILEKYLVPVTVFLTTGPISSGDIIWTDKVTLLNKQQKNIAKEQKEHFKNLPNYTKDLEMNRLLFQYELDIKSIPDHEKMLTWDDARLMAEKGVEFGAHTVNHSILTAVDIQEAREEIIDSKLQIESVTGKKVTTFCYPNGQKKDFNETIKKILYENGFKCAVTAIEGKINKGDDLLALKRIALGNRNPALVTLKLIKEILRNITEEPS